MIFDNVNEDRYFVVMPDGSIENGWKTGLELQQKQGSPIQTENIEKLTRTQKVHNKQYPIHIKDLWPDTIDYDQNNPGIIDKARDIESRLYKSNLEQSFWMNVLRVPGVCVTYLAACAKVKPRTILEFGTGGDSAHSTGMFLHWLNGEGLLVSVDRHYLSHSWLRYRNNLNWKFIQGDSITVMNNIIYGKFPIQKIWDMIFIDSSHNYPHTLNELRHVSYMTDAILMDDTTCPGVDQSIKEFMAEDTNWLRCDLASTVCLLERHEKI